jgi:FkbM family methyltransferase
VSTGAKLDALLSRDSEATRNFEAAAFDTVSQGRKIVLMGAGNLGRRTAVGLRDQGIEPLAFADNDPGKQGTIVEGLPVLSPPVAAARFRERAVFVVTIWGASSSHRYAQSYEQLVALGCDAVCSFAWLYWKYPRVFLPFYLQDLPSRVLEERNAVGLAFDLWADEQSRAEYLAQVRLRLLGDFGCLAHPVAHPQYLADDLFEWRRDEVFVDGGAYDGDSIRAIASRHGSSFRRILALEPDPVNFARLKSTVAGLPPDIRDKIDCRQQALAASKRRLFVDATGTAASTAHVEDEPGRTDVAADTLDSIVGERATFIKLDIEGFELDALQGAKGTIENAGPIVAACVYHRQNHLWRIPLLLRSLRDDYAFFLRPHNEEGWDLVCYAIPRWRQRQ